MDPLRITASIISLVVIGGCRTTDLSNTKSAKPNATIQIVDEIVNLIIDIMENKLLRKYVIKKYSSDSSEEIQKIYMCALNMFKEKYFI